MDETMKKFNLEALEDVFKVTEKTYAKKGTTLADYGITDALTEEEIQVLIDKGIANADHLTRKFVDSVDSIDLTADDAENYVYMVPNTDTSDENNLYIEYMVANGVLEKVGKWTVSMDGYYTSEQTDEAIKKAIDESVVDISTETSGNGNVITSASYNSETGTLTFVKEITALTANDFEDFTEAEIQEAYDAAVAAVAAESEDDGTN